MPFDQLPFLRINLAKVVHETIEDEVLIINTESGAYYSLRGSAASIWSGIERGLSGPMLRAALLRRYTAGEAEIAAAIDPFVAELLAEDIVVLADAPNVETPLPAVDLAEAPPEPFVRPAIEKFSEMADLLTLDPIHDVDAAGWPYTKQRA
jgi:hypothetical protein